MELKLKEHLQVNKDDVSLHDVSSYRRLIGKLHYLTITIPNISFAVKNLRQFMQEPKVSHLEFALRIIRYVKKESGKGILLSLDFVPKLVGYCDSD